MTIRFYNSFSKRKNSTKKPANTDTHYDIDVVLKEDTTIERPSIVLTNREGTASGNPVTVSALGGNMVSPVVTFNPMQSGSGTPSPSNPRPIVSYGDIQVTVNGVTTTIDIDGVKYGGTLNIETGVLTVKYGFINTFQRLNIDSSGKLWKIGNLAQHAPTTNTYYEQITNMFECVSLLQCRQNTDLGIKSVVCYGNGVFISGYIGDESSLDAILPSMQACYQLQTPFTVQLTPAHISLLQGTNTVTVNGNSTIAFGYTAEEIATDYCYAYIPKWNKYYFVVTPNILTNYHVQYNLEEDYLASRKTEVGSTVAHIVYSSTGYDAYIVDSRLPVKTTVTTDHVSKSSGLDANGCYILSLITDKANGKTGAIGHYLMDETNLQHLVANLYDISIASVVAEAFYSPMDMIANCIWIPVSYSDASALCAASSSITLNNSPINTSGRPVVGCQVTTPIKIYSSVPIPIPGNVSDFRDQQPYTSASLYLPGIGLTDLNINDFAGSANVNVYLKVDITNGDIIYWIFNDHNDVVKTVSFNGAEPVPLAHIAANSKGALTGIGGAAAMVASSMLGAGNLTQMLTAGSLMAAGSTALSFNQRAVSMKGGYSGRSSFAETVYMLTIVKQNTADPTNANYIARWGRPVGKTQAISNHSGYVQCEAASVALAGDNTEREIINNYLNNGFFYE